MANGATTRELVEGLPTEFRRDLTPSEINQIKQGLRDARNLPSLEQLRAQGPIEPNYVTTQELADRGLRKQMYRNFPPTDTDVRNVMEGLERNRDAVRGARRRAFERLAHPDDVVGPPRKRLAREAARRSLAKRAAGVVLNAAPAMSAAYESVFGAPTDPAQGLRNLRDVTGRYPTRTPYAMSENLSSLARMVGGGEGAQYAASNVGQFADEAAGHFLEKAPRVADAATGGLASGLGGEIMNRIIEASQPEGRLRFIPEPTKLRGQRYGPTTIGIRG